MSSGVAERRLDGPRPGDAPASGPSDDRLETILPRPSGGPMARLWPFVRPDAGSFLLAIAASVVGQSLSGVGPLVQRSIIDGAIVDGRRPSTASLALLAALGLVSFVLMYVRRWVGGRSSVMIQDRLRIAMLRRLVDLDDAGHDELRSGQLVSRATTDLGNLQQVTSMIGMVVGMITLVVVAIVAMFTMSTQLTLVVLAIVPLTVAVSFKVRSGYQAATWDVQQRAGEVANVVEEAVSGVRVVKGFGAEEREIARLRGAAGDLYRSSVRLNRMEAKLSSLLTSLPTLGQVAVLAFGGWLAVNGRLTIGTYLAFSAYLLQLIPSVRSLTMFALATFRARASAQRVLDVLDLTPTLVERADPIELSEVAGEVRFEGVSFAYRDDQPVLDGFDLTIAPGETVALVGPSGSGKTTVTSLIGRFRDPTAGRVLLDGVDLRDLSFGSLRRHVGMAFEEAILVSDTVANNVAYGRWDATEDEIWAALRVAGADRFVRELPRGLETVVGERGLTLSGGQRQRLALARTVLVAPEVLVLDDATSAVDTSTEAEIHRALATVLAGRTTVLVAHRESTVRLADRVVFIDEGRVVASGPHEVLARRWPRYAELLGVGEPQGDVDTLEARAAGRDGSDARPVRRPSEAPIPDRFAPPPELAVAHAGLPPLRDEPPALDRTVTDPVETTSFRLLGFIRPWRRAFALGLGLVAAQAVFEVLGPFLIRLGVDGVRAGSWPRVRLASLAFAGTAAATVATQWIGTLVTARTAERVLYALRLRVFTHLQRLGIDFYDRERDGRILTRMTGDIAALTQVVTAGLLTGVVAVFTGVGVTVLLVAQSPRLAAITATIVPFIVLATVAYRAVSGVAYRNARTAIADANAEFQENISVVRVTRSVRRETHNIARFAEIQRVWVDARLRSQRAISLYFPGMRFLSDAATVVVLAASGPMVGRHGVTPGVVIAFLLSLDLAFSPILQLSMIFDSWQQAGAASQKLAELLSTPTSTPAPTDPLPLGRLSGRIELRDVSYRYPGADEDALHDVSLEIAPGETVALVGPTGAGKSTLVRLVSRFQDPTGGVVLVDGLPLDRVDLARYRRQLGVVPQEPFLFSGTLRDNLAYGRPGASDDEIIGAARRIGADPLLHAVPHGLDTELHERGRSLSAGQRQLVALVRAELVDPRILVLDEATANLDLATEATVRRAMSAVTSGRTTLLVAHRLPTARAADRIVVVDHGRIEEMGTHDELLAARGHYARLWDAQTAE
ncbi:MAG: ABC transporter ATP-binding protein [Ilumatobacteraceae bacterium]